MRFKIKFVDNVDTYGKGLFFFRQCHPDPKNLNTDPAIMSKMH